MSAALVWRVNYQRNGARSRSTLTAYLAHSALLIHSSLAVSRQLITAAPFQHVSVGSASYNHTDLQFTPPDTTTPPSSWHRTVRTELVFYCNVLSFSHIFSSRRSTKILKAQTVIDTVNSIYVILLTLCIHQSPAQCVRSTSAKSKV